MPPRVSRGAGALLVSAVLGLDLMKLRVADQVSPLSAPSTAWTRQ